MAAERARPDVAAASGFSLHAGVSARGSDREKLEHLARYIARPPVATERLALTDSGHIRYTLKTPYRDGTTHVIFEIKVIANIEEPEVIARILAHLGRNEAAADPAHPRQAKRRRSPSRGPPQGRLPI